MKIIILSIFVMFLSAPAYALMVEEPEADCKRNPLSLPCAKTYPATTIAEIFKNQKNDFQSYSVKPLDAKGVSNLTTFETENLGVHLTWSKKERKGIVNKAAGALKDFLIIDVDDYNIEMTQKKGACTYPYILSKKEKGPITCRVSESTRLDAKCSKQVNSDPLITKQGVCNQFITAMLLCSRSVKHRDTCSDTLYSSDINLDPENSKTSTDKATPASKEAQGNN